MNNCDDDEKSSNEENDKENLEKLKKLKEKLSRKGSRSEMDNDPDTGITAPLLLFSRLSKTHFQVSFKYLQYANLQNGFLDWGVTNMLLVTNNFNVMWYMYICYHNHILVIRIANQI